MADEKLIPLVAIHQIHVTTVPGKWGKPTDGIPHTPPKKIVIHPKTVFTAASAMQQDEFLSNGAAVPADKSSKVTLVLAQAERAAKKGGEPVKPVDPDTSGTGTDMV
jgi:hypothetical protein